MVGHDPTEEFNHGREVPSGWVMTPPRKWGVPNLWVVTPGRNSTVRKEGSQLVGHDPMRL